MTNVRSVHALTPALAAALMMLSGCGGSQRAGSMNQVVADYQAQRYVQAYSAAKSMTRSSSTNTRAQASYMAGLSAYKLGNRDDAERYLLVASSSTDPDVAPKAGAMLGVLRIDQHREREAVVLLEKVQPLLTGDDARQAAAQLAYAHQQIGDTAEAKQWMARSNSSSTYSSTTDRVSGELFALQVGAFRSKEHAESAASIAARQADKLGLGPMRIVPSRDDRGQMLYLVQFGSFPTRTSAASTRSRLGKLDYIVAPLAMPST